MSVFYGRKMVAGMEGEAERERWSVCVCVSDSNLNVLVFICSDGGCALMKKFPDSANRSGAVCVCQCRTEPNAGQKAQKAPTAPERKQRQTPKSFISNVETRRKSSEKKNGQERDRCHCLLLGIRPEKKLQ